MDNKWIICLGAGNSQVSLINIAKSLGYKVLAIDRNSDAPGFEYADKSIIESTHDTETIIEKIKGFELCGLLARCTGGALFTAAAITKKYILCGVNYDLAKIATSKSALRRFCEKNDIKVPYGKKIKNYNELEEMEFHREIIIKPDFTIVGKQSISKIDRSDRQNLANCIKMASLSSANQFVEVEDFIEGYDCSYLTWIQNGVSSILLTWDELIGFNEDGALFQYGVSMPSISLEAQHESKIKKILDSFAKCFPDVSTLLSFSFRVDKFGDPWLIELHADLTGDLILDKLAPSSTGNDILTNITKLFINSEIGIKFNIGDDFIQKPAAILYKNIVDKENINLLTAESIYLLHTKINILTGPKILEQKRVLESMKTQGHG